MKNLKLLMSLVMIILVIAAICSCTAQHEHEFTNEWTSDSIHHWHVCTEEGCYEKLDSAEHTFAAPAVKVPATEKEEGVLSHVCMVCGFEKTEPIAKLPHEHEMTKHEQVDPTCTEDGVKPYYSCSLCNGIFVDEDGVYAVESYETIAKLGHADEDADHKCDRCNTSVGTHAAAEGTHVCDYCGEVASDCTPAEDDGDCTTAINCSVCGVEMIPGNDSHDPEDDDDDCTTPILCKVCDSVVVEGNTTHVFNQGTHTCKVCGKTTSTCVDDDNNHKCDACKVVLSTCLDEDQNHKCDICGKTLSYCADGNNDHNCDFCGKLLTSCFDGNKNHKCDLCRKVITDCIDENKDHVCDICGYTSSSCYDNNKDHKCDLCEDVLSTCADCNNDHNCDVCGTALTKCDDNYDAGVITTPAKCVYEGVKTYTCQICGGTKTEPVAATGVHVDAVKDYSCDDCGLDLRTKTRFEAEHSKIHNGTITIENTDRASNGTLVGYFRVGKVMVFVIESDRAETNVPLTICGATANESNGALLEIPAAEIASMLACNGVALRDATGSFAGSSSYDWYNFTKVEGYIDLAEGVNYITFTNLGPNMNMDYVELTTREAQLSWTAHEGTLAEECTSNDNNHNCDVCGRLAFAHTCEPFSVTGSVSYDATTGVFDTSALVVGEANCNVCGEAMPAYTLDTANAFTSGIVVTRGATKVTVPAFNPTNYTTSSAKTGGNDPAPVVTTTFTSGNLTCTVTSNNFLVADGKVYSRYELSLLNSDSVNVSYDGNTYIYNALSPVTLTKEIRTYGCMLTVEGNVTLNLTERWTHNNGVIIGSANKTANVKVTVNGGNAIFFWDGADMIINEGSTVETTSSDVHNIWSASVGSQIIVDGTLITHGHIFLLANAEWAHPEGDNYNLKPHLYVRNGEVVVNNGNIYANFVQVGSVKNNYTGKITINNGGFAKRDENINVQIRWAFSQGELNFNNTGNAITGAMITDQNNKDRAITFDAGIKVTVKGSYGALIRHQWSSWANVAVHTDAKFDLPESTNFYCMSNNYSDSNINFWNSATIMLDGREQTVWVANESQFKVSGQVKDFTRNEILPVVNADGSRSAAKVVPAAGSYTTTDGYTVIGDWQSICKKAVNENGDVIYYIIK